MTNQESNTTKVEVAYRRPTGVMYLGHAEEFFASRFARRYEGKVQLIFTSPPFPLNTKKNYGNFQQEEYLQWLAKFAPLFRKLLKRNGSIVVEMGNAWEPGKPL